MSKGQFRGQVIEIMILPYNFKVNYLKILVLTNRRYYLTNTNVNKHHV